MNSILTWLVTSSADPDQIALTVKGFLVALLPIIIALTGIDAELAGSIVGQLVAFIQAALMILGTGVTLVGLARKIKLARWAHPGAV